MEINYKWSASSADTSVIQNVSRIKRSQSFESTMTFTKLRSGLQTRMNIHHYETFRFWFFIAVKRLQVVNLELSFPTLRKKKFIAIY